MVLGLHRLAKARMVVLADLPSEITAPCVAKTGLTEVFAAQKATLACDASLKQAEVRAVEGDGWYLP